MLGALLGTVIGGVPGDGAAAGSAPKVIHDPRIHDGKILSARASRGDEQAGRVMDAMKSAGGIDVRPEEGEL